MIIAIDFDGTIVESAFPEIGKPLDDAIESLKELIADGHFLILHTCREDERKRKYLTEAVDFLKRNGVVFDSVNCNSERTEFRDAPGRKVYANIYIDDKMPGGMWKWKDLLKWVKQLHRKKESV